VWLIFTKFLLLKVKIEPFLLQTETISTNRNRISKYFPNKQRRKHRNDVLLNHVEVLERTKAGVATSSVLAEAGF